MEDQTRRGPDSPASGPTPPTAPHPCPCIVANGGPDTCLPEKARDIAPTCENSPSSWQVTYKRASVNDGARKMQKTHAYSSETDMRTPWKRKKQTVEEPENDDVAGPEWKRRRPNPSHSSKSSNSAKVGAGNHP